MKDFSVKCSCKNILVVDDEFFNIKTIQIMLKNLTSVKVYTASNGLKAYNVVKEKSESNKCEDCLFFS